MAGEGRAALSSSPAPPEHRDGLEPLGWTGELESSYLKAPTGEAGNVGGEDQRENTHVGEDLSAEVISKLVVRLKQ